MEGGNYGSGRGMKAEKLKRKIVEKNRRILMKELLFQLSSIIPNSQYNASGQQELLEEATTYIKKLKERVETLELQKKHRTNYMNNGKVTIQVSCLDACMEIVLMSRLMNNKSFKLGEVICILEEEGAEVIHANFSKMEDMIMHIIHFQAISSRIGYDEKRVKERFEDLVSRWNVVELER